MSGETTWRLVPLNGITKEMRRGAQREARHARTSEPFSVLSAKIRGGIDAAPKPPAGLYEAREDGSVRRVEWETAIDQLAETIEAPAFMRNPDGSYVYPEIVRTAARERVRAVIRFLTEGR